VAEEVIPEIVRIFRLQFPGEELFARADRANARSIRICRRLGFAELRQMETDAEIFFRILPVAT
jgi:RimJ/RimL family protein N-acetyltransferase